MSMNRLAIQLEDFHTVDAPLIDAETKGSTHKMEALYSGCTGIYHQHIPLRITHYFQNMRMTADKQVGLISVYKFVSSYIVSSRIAPDMGHQHFHPLTFKKAVQGMSIAKTMIVTVSCDSDQRLICGNLLSQLHPSTEIARMPYLVHLRKEVLEFLGEHSVCV